MAMPALKPLDAAAPAAPSLTVLPDPKPARSRSKLNLGGAATAPATSKSGKIYPSATLTDDQRKFITGLIDAIDELDALEGRVESEKAMVNEMILPQWFEKAQGQLEPPSSILIPSADHRVAKLIVAGDTGGRYSGTKDAAAVDRIAEIVGEDLFPELFTEKVTFKIDLGKVPEEKQQALIDDLMAVARKHGQEQAFTATPLWVPTPIARKSRFTRLTLEQNLALQALMPITPSFKAKA